MTDKKQKINLTLIRNLANILNETNLTEVEIDNDGMRIRLLRSPQKDTVTNYYSEDNKNNHSLVGFPPSSTIDNTPPESDLIPLLSPDNYHTVTSPMVGTAYLASSPGSDPFVNKGNLVVEGQTLLIIEAMKTMNHIVAPCSGKVQDINVNDGQSVEYGDALLVLEKTGDNK
ncbi:acetyl-CoA carboxylase biotin carboxyl carrier protein [Candidatus Liberibacter asiaticus]|uniref:acetyl-CoA carboxylase biotin carboxyl carrier protein n=1 Tax=Liberibacter asiaticus TaxID=34021 RepID=UPI000703A8E8|nr:acetyl-CoA carboxylase biotin carboxyl carrier protein subunit [Candidatus Liberibacter asiaticus]KRF68796.1 acetyl-CoA carboxylase biotin carboxyl carrier protein [Candidatus Liberibacter asiaticus]